MFYDFHIHSCLSPCSDNNMTPNNIVNMALLKKLDRIAICDHNSTKQQRAIHEVAKRHHLSLLYGVEIQTLEEVHVCCYFKTIQQIEDFQLWMDSKQGPFINDEAMFGQQLIMDDKDQVIGSEEKLLLTSLNASLDEVCDATHRYAGRIVLAHVLDRVNSITYQLGFIPRNCDFDGIEIKSDEEKEKVLMQAPWITDTTWLINSDAHQLVDISESTHAMTDEEYSNFWRVR